MHRNELCLDFRAVKIDIHAHIGDDIRFGMTVSLAGEPLPAADYSVETFIFDENDVEDEEHDFTVDSQDGVCTFVLEDAATTEMGVGNFSYAIVFTLTAEGDDYDRTYVNGILSLTARSVPS